MWNISEKNNGRENQNIHFMFNNFFFFKNCAVYEIMWKNKVQLDRPQTTMSCCTENMRFAYWITKAKIQTHAHNIQQPSLFHSNNGYMNAPQCFLTCTLLVLLDKWYVITNLDWFRTRPSESFVHVSPDTVLFTQHCFPTAKLFSQSFYTAQKCYTVELASEHLCLCLHHRHVLTDGQVQPVKLK